MFDATIYASRRAALRKQLGGGLALFIGNVDCSRNYPANPYDFRQDSTFLYFFGLNLHGLAAVIDCDHDRDIVFGSDPDVEDIVWLGPQPLLADTCRRVGVHEVLPPDKLADVLAEARRNGRKIHFLPPYRRATALQMENLLGIRAGSVKLYASAELSRAVVALRSLKSPAEVAEIEQALDVSFEMYRAAKEMIRPGVYEREIRGCMEGISLASGAALAYPPIITVHGETLHNHYYGNRLEAGQLLLIDVGAESRMFYASDITRTYPVDGALSARQKPIYSLVHQALRSATAAVKPGVKYRDIHLQVCRLIAAGLKEVGLMKGDPAEAVAQGAHALFFPHGLGHMMGLDVHDMEDIGEDYVGYDTEVRRSTQFGLAYLRLARALQPGFVFTVEPGIYFIPVLIDQWRAAGKHTDFIRYDEVEKYKGFGGIRLEDNVLVTDTGHRVLGKPIPTELD